jgi:hypothetical protein
MSTPLEKIPRSFFAGERKIPRSRNENGVKGKIVEIISSSRIGRAPPLQV